MGTVLRLVVGAPDHIVIEVIAVKILGQAVRHVHAEAIGAVIEPEAQGPEKIVAHLTIVPVPVRLFLGEHMQIPLAVGHAGPCRAAEMVLPVGRWLIAIRTLAVAEDIAVTLRRSRFGCEGGLEPFVQIGAVIRHDVDHDLDVSCVCGLGEFVEIIHGSELRVDVAVIVHVVATVGQLGRIERTEPDGVDAKVLQIVDLFGHTGNLAESLATGVLEGTRVDLIDHGLLPPQCGIGDFSHFFLLSCKRLYTFLTAINVTHHC